VPAMSTPATRPTTTGCAARRNSRSSVTHCSVLAAGADQAVEEDDACRIATHDVAYHTGPYIALEQEYDGEPDRSAVSKHLKNGEVSIQDLR
jgi:hypothetical protein